MLLGFIGLSIVTHAFAFLIFQVVYPQKVTIPPPSMQVALLTPSTPEQQAILRWVDAEDPALAAGGAVAVPPSIFEIPYQPSYATLRTPPRTMAAARERPEPPPSPISLPFLPEIAPALPPAAKQTAAVPGSAAEFGGLLASRSFQPGAALAVRAANPLEPATFLIAVNADGQVTNVFRQHSSGDDAADRGAADYLAAGTFSARAGEPVAWGLATITWGREIYAEPATK
jgi:hypothetical protein